jgi:hypothetical protein
MQSDHVIDDAREQAFEFFNRYQTTGDPQLLLAAASQFRRSIQVARDADLRKASDLSDVCFVLTEFYRKTDELWALDDAAAAGRAALGIGRDPDDSHMAMTRLGIALSLKFRATGAHAALVESLACLRAAGRAADPIRPASMASLFHLAEALHLAYSDSEDVALLNEAVEVGRLAARNRHPTQIASLVKLTRDLSALSYVRQDMNLLREAEAAARWAVQITAGSDADDRAICLLELARTLEDLYLNTSQLAYLEEAVDAADAAVGLTRDSIQIHLRSMIAANMAKQLQESGVDGATTDTSGTPPPPPLIR